VIVQPIVAAWSSTVIVQPIVAASPAVVPASDGRRLYIVAAWVPRHETIVVGSLGAIAFPRGWYAYVGSARRGRDARVARHRRAGKPLRWHADHLFSRYPAGRAWLIDTRRSECELAASLGGEVVPRFGSSDCGCPGHLVRLPRLACLRGALAAAAGDELTRERRQ
jgi:Uri superfamily endonuclease